MFSLFRKREAWSVPEGQRVYAIGDIHGCRNQLAELTEVILRDSESGPKEQKIIYLGDYVDRGPDSHGVIEDVLNPDPKFEVRYLRGNHDQIMLDFLTDSSIYSTWERLGAQETLLSYGVTPPQTFEPDEMERTRELFIDALPRRHRIFFENLLSFTEVGHYYFAHAGVRPGVRLEDQEPDDLLWIREPFLSSKADFGKVVVHGHTPRARPIERRNRIGIDTGAYMSGCLTAVVLEGPDVRFIQSGPS